MAPVEMPGHIERISRGAVSEIFTWVHNYICEAVMFVESPFQKTSQYPAQELGDHALTGSAKPFLKWVGGKTQLIEQLDANVPPELKEGLIESYVEPFVGGGSFFLHVAQKYRVKKLVIADSNQDLILSYWTIRDKFDSLIDVLHRIQTKYLSLSDDRRQDFYYKTRDEFNENKLCIDMRSYSDGWIERTAQLIFLNKTCFNGLFRVNSSGLFNVAFGRYENPKICDPDNLIAVSQILERTQILLGDFTCVLNLLDSKTFAYLDPPYRPLTATSNFTGYSSSTFTPRDQQRLAEFCRQATSRGALIMISNSDPDNIDPKDTYFQDNYPGYRIVRAFANRMVNCKADKRGKISELIIMNYPRQSKTVELKLFSGKDVRKAVKSNQSKGPEGMPPGAITPRRNSAALGAYKLLRKCANDGASFDIEDLQKATGWKLQTARTYVSKKWKNYLESVDGANTAQFRVRPAFLQLDEESFLLEFSQVLASKPLPPKTIEEAKQQTMMALNTYADLLREAKNIAGEKKVRALVDQINSV